MGFDDLNKAMSEQETDESTTDVNPDSARQQGSHDLDGNQGQSSNSAKDDSGESPSTSSLNHPAFPFADSKQEAIYPTVETLDKFDDVLDLDVKRRLRDEGLRDTPKREYHEALLQLAIDQPERLAEIVIENRK